MVILGREPEAIKYRKLFEYMKQYGVEPFQKFFDEYNYLTSKDLLKDAILDGRHQTTSFAKKHSDVLHIIRELEGKNGTFLSANFSCIFDTVDKDNLSKCIEGAYALEELGISRVSYSPLGFLGTTCMYYDGKGQIDAIEKIYTNGNISYSLNPVDDSYITSVSFPKLSTGRFVIPVQHQRDLGEYRYAYISDFCFDPSTLPSSDELSSLEPPKSLTGSKVYVKKV